MVKKQWLIRWHGDEYDFLMKDEKCSRWWTEWAIDFSKTRYDVVWHDSDSKWMTSCEYSDSGGETWMSRATSESKQQPMAWRYASSPTKKKNQVNVILSENMCTVFWDIKRVVPMGHLVSRLHNQLGCLLQNVKKLRRTMQNRRRGMLTRSIVFIHDNGRAHTASGMQHLPVFAWK